MFNILPISSTNLLYPLSSYYLHDSELKLKGDIQQFANGYILVDNEIFNKTKDNAFGKDTAFYITSSVNLFNFIDNDKNLDIFDLSTYVALKADNGYYLTNINNDIYATATQVTSSEFFKIEKNDDNTISILSQDNYYATVNRYAPWNITFVEKYIVDTYNQQKFDYKLSNNKIYFVTLFTNPYPLYNSGGIIRHYISYSPINSQLRAIGTTFDDDYIPNNAYLFTLSNIYVSASNIDFNGNIKWVKYYNELTDKTDNNNTNIKTSIETIQNYLVNAPYKTKINNNGDIGLIGVDIANLKTIETPEYEYTYTPVGLDNNVVSNNEDRIKRRDYNKIFVGSNQDEGYDNPYLGFTSNTKQLILKNDSTTYFHYPSTAPIIPLSSSGLIEAGSTAGLSPYRSDRIYKKMANYSHNIYWGDSRQQQHGVWLCSWLSGNFDSNVTPVWKDRWYDPGYVSTVWAETAIETTYNNNTLIIWDEDSSITFDPGVWYSYTHIGNVNNQSIINTLTGNGTALRCLTSEELYFDGNSYSYMPYVSTYKSTNNISHSIWIKINDCNNIKSSNIISNNYRSGWNLSITNNFFTPLVLTYDTTYGHLLFMNNEGKVYLDRLVPNLTSTTFAEPTSVAIDDKLYTYILDNKYKILYKIDYNGDIIDQVIFNSGDVLKKVLIDKDKNIIVWKNNTCDYYEPTILNYIKTAAIPVASKAINIDLDNNIVNTTGIDICIDNDNNEWTVQNGKLYKESNIILDRNDLISVKCDKNNHLWTINNTTEFIKLSSTGSLILSGNIGIENSSNRSFGFTDELNNDYVWFVNPADYIIYKCDTNGSTVDSVILTNNIDLTKYLDHNKSSMNFVANGDFTNYDWCRKYKYIPNNKQNVIESQIYIGTSNSLSSMSLYYPTSSLVDNEWHHFTTTYSQSGEFKLYVDSILRNTTIVEPNIPIYYEYENPIIFGSTNGKLTTIDNEIQTNIYKYNGYIKDFRFYDYPINISDISHIYRLQYNFNDIVWNIPTGTQSYIEEVERFFKHKLPGMKSQFYNIRLIGLNITNIEIRNMIEGIIKDNLKKIVPAYAELYKIIWE